MIAKAKLAVLASEGKKEEGMELVIDKRRQEEIEIENFD